MINFLLLMKKRALKNILILFLIYFVFFPWFYLSLCEIENGASVVIQENYDSNKTREKLLEKNISDHSASFQNDLKFLQKRSCEEKNFICGVDHVCGLGCYLHHIIACMMMSHALNMPVIYHQNNWLYSLAFEDVFKSVGSKCKPGRNTYEWNWYYKALRPLRNGLPEIPYPFQTGLVINASYCSKLQKFHPKPFLWFVGQFTKFALQLQPNVTEMISLQKGSIVVREQQNRQSGPIVGLHVRRTDKGIETGNTSYHDIHEYFDGAENFFKVLGKQTNKRVFVSSDDTSVLPDAKERYPSWEVLGFSRNLTYSHQNARWSSLLEVLADLYVLAESDFLVCGMSSNICRLAWEIMSIDKIDSNHRVHSLEPGYVYVLLNRPIYPLIVCRNYLHPKFV